MVDQSVQRRQAPPCGPRHRVRRTGPIAHRRTHVRPTRLPLPDKNDMDWGVAAEWYRAMGRHFRPGVIDSCRVVHWDRSATTYPTAPEMVAMKNHLARRGLDSARQLQSVSGDWWKSQPSPSWVQGS